MSSLVTRLKRSTEQRALARIVPKTIAEQIEELYKLHQRRLPCGRLAYHPIPLVNLSERDILWLQQLSHGMVIKELKGVTSEQAAKNRILRIRKFLGAYNTTQAVAVAIRQGIIK